MQSSVRSFDSPSLQGLGSQYLIAVHIVKYLSIWKIVNNTSLVSNSTTFPNVQNQSIHVLFLLKFASLQCDIKNSKCALPHSSKLLDMFAYDSQVHITLKFKLENSFKYQVKNITYPRSALLISANSCVLPGFQRLYLKVTEQGGRRWTRCPGFKICTDLLALINCHCQL